MIRLEKRLVLTHTQSNLSIAVGVLEMIHDPTLVKLVKKQTDLFNADATLVEKENIAYQIQNRQKERLRHNDSDD